MQLLEHFKELTLHPKNAEELKGLFLQLAVQGKLTRQWREENPHVEPASVLMERIKDEKERLIKEKKIKKEKILPEISEEEIPFLLPNCWKICRVGNISTIKGGKRIPKGFNFSDQETPHVYIRVTDMKNGSVSFDKLKYISEEVFKKINQYTISKNDLYITIAGTIGDVGEIPDELDNMNLTENAAKIIFYQVDKLFLKTILRSNVCQSQFLEKINQMAQPKLALHRVASTIIPLPPLEEQQAIVEVLNQLFAEVEQLEALTKERIQVKADFVTSALNRLTQAAEHDTAGQWEFLQKHFGTFFTEKENIKILRESILQLAVQGKLTHHWRAAVRMNGVEVESAATLLDKIKFEKEQLIKAGKIKKERPLPEISDDEIPYELPEGWVWCRFGTIIESMANGLYKPANFYTEKGIISLRMFNIQSGFIEFQGAKRVEVSDEELNRYSLSENDLLINRVNSFELIGKTAIIPLIDEKMVYESMNIRTRLIFKNSIAPYFNQFLQSEYARNYLMSNSKQAIGQASINQTTICNLFSPLPPIKEQKAIVEKVNFLMELCDKLEQEIETHQTTQEQWMESCLREVFEG